MNKYGRSFAFVIILILSTSTLAFARGFPSQQAERAQAAGRLTLATMQVAPETEESGAGGVDIPIKVYVADSPEGTYILASLGTFPFDVTAVRGEFMSQNFLERFWKDTVSSRDAALTSQHALKIDFLPQHNDNERECAFSDGDVTGRMYVLVKDNKVYVLCFYGADQSKYNIASAGQSFELLRRRSG